MPIRCSVNASPLKRRVHAPTSMFICFLGPLSSDPPTGGMCPNTQRHLSRVIYCFGGHI